MTKLLLVMVVLLVGCSKSKSVPCLDRPDHRFGKWEVTEEYKSASGYHCTRVQRFCEDCNWMEKDVVYP